MSLLSRLRDRRALIPSRGVHDRSSVPADELRRALLEGGWPTYVLEGAPQTTREFIAAVSDSLPTQPHLGRNESWDGMHDSLRWGVIFLPTDRAAILWPGSKRLAEGDPDGYKTAREILKLIAWEAEQPPGEADPFGTTRLLVLLA